MRLYQRRRVNPSAILATVIMAKDPGPIQSFSALRVGWRDEIVPYGTQWFLGSICITLDWISLPTVPNVKLQLKTWGMICSIVGDHESKKELERHFQRNYGTPVSG